MDKREEHRQFVAIARALLPEAERELATAEAVVREIGARVTMYRSAIQLDEQSKAPLVLTASSIEAANALAKPPPDRIESALIELGPIQFKDLLKHFSAKGEPIAESTLYSKLSKGKSEGRYLNRNRKWELAKE